jgi:hypothetical protein
MFYASEHDGAVRMHKLNGRYRLAHGSRFHNFRATQANGGGIGSSLRPASNPILSPKCFLAPFDNRDFKPCHISLYALC